MQKPKKVLIDGDAVVFRAGFANERSKNGELLSLNPEHYAFHTAKMIIKRIMKETECDEYEIYLSDTEKTNFRYKVAKSVPYKGNRKDSKRPEHEHAIRKYLFEYWEAIEIKGCEVDDALGINQDKEHGSTIIATNDKDLDMIPGWHYDLDFGVVRNNAALKAYKSRQIYYVRDPGFIDLRENGNKKKIIVGAGQLWFCVQMLSGDKIDNVIGLPKYGPVKIFDVLRDCKTYQKAVNAVYKEYKKAGKTLEEFLENAKLLYIKRNVGEKIFPIEWVDL